MTYYFFVPKVVCLRTYGMGDAYFRGNCSTITWHRPVLYSTQKATRLKQDPHGKTFNY